ncbi:MAG: helix-turn-helix transcriptional regulator [Oenococcus oeni]
MKQTLRKWRRDKNLSQHELAKQAGISPRTIATWEKNNDHFRKASVGRVEAVSKVLNINLDDFILDPTSKILKSS